MIYLIITLRVIGFIIGCMIGYNITSTIKDYCKHLSYIKNSKYRWYVNFTYKDLKKEINMNRETLYVPSFAAYSNWICIDDICHQFISIEEPKQVYSRKIQDKDVYFRFEGFFNYIICRRMIHRLWKKVIYCKQKTILTGRKTYIY